MLQPFQEIIEVLSRMIYTVREAVLKERLAQLDWTTYRLAKELSIIRGKGSTSSYTSSVARAVESPNTASVKTFEELVQLLGGEIVIRWPKTETVVKGYEEVKSPTPS